MYKLFIRESDGVKGVLGGSIIKVDGGERLRGIYEA